MLGRLKIWQKLTLIVLVMATAIPVIFYLIITRDTATIDFGQTERYGIELLVPTDSLFAHALDYRDMLASTQAGNASWKDDLASLRQAIDEDITELAAVHQKLGALLTNNKEKVSDRLQAVQADWQSLKSAAERPDGDLHDRFVGHVVELVTQIGDSSNLILDPDIDTYYLMTALITQIPPLADDLGRLRAAGEGPAARKSASLDERLQLASLDGRVQLIMDAITIGMQGSAFPFNKELEKLIAPDLTSTSGAVKATREQLRNEILQAETIDVDPRQFFDTVTAALAQLFKLRDVQLETLDRLIEARIVRFRADKVYIIGATILGIALAVVLSVLIARAIIRQINHINNAFAEFKKGSYNARAPVTTQDELGVMARSLNDILDSTVKLIRSREERERKSQEETALLQKAILKLLDEVSDAASGDLTVEAEVTADATGAIADSFNLMIGELRSIIANVKETVLQVSSAANEIQTTAEHLTRGSESQAEQIVDTSAAIDEMAVSIQQVSENAGISATVAQQSLTNARQGSEAVKKTIDGMNGIRDQVRETSKRIKRLGESSQEIGEIIQLIGDIADRTSILALNASIQAAMAGEAGRGFAVVAEEVERLAVRSTEATKRIGSLVKTIQTETGEAVTAMETTTTEVVRGSKLADEAGRALEQIETVSNRLAEFIQSISLASKQQARGSEALAKSMGDISQITQQTAAGTKQAAISLANLTVLAEELRESVSRFKLPVNGSAKAG